ncbi:MAG: alpha/beta fold hydrolase [Acidimicrobiales bacterium]
MRLAVNGTTLFFDIEGAKLVADGPKMRERPTVVLLHGGPGFDHSGFKPAYSALTDTAQLVYVDHRGNGRSDRSDPDSWRLDTWGDDVFALCEALEIERPIVLGWSFGGFVAINYASRYPGHAAGLILQSTSARLDVERVVEGFRARGGDEAAEAARAFWTTHSDEAAMPYLVHCIPVYDPGPMDPDEITRIELNLDLARGFEGETEMDQRAALGKVSCPTLVLVGGVDPITPRASAEEMMEALPSGSARLEVFETAGHNIAQAEPERFFDVVRRFISEVVGALAKS